jgi:hypothetical protein
MYDGDDDYNVGDDDNYDYDDGDSNDDVVTNHYAILRSVVS